MNAKTLHRANSLSPTSIILVVLILLFTSFAGALRAQTVSTDKPDYMPGDFVVITGEGWMPGETVELLIRHTTFTTHPDETFSTVALAGGFIYDASYVIDPWDLGETFLLTATGLTSGAIATAEFTDGAPFNVTFYAANLPNGVLVQVQYQGTNNGGNPVNTTVSFTTPGNSGAIGFLPGSLLTFSYLSPVAGGYYHATTQPVQSPWPVPNASGGSLSIAGIYQAGCTPPGFTMPPIPKYNVCLGSTATFNATVSGSTPITYEWFKGVPGTGTPVGTNSPSFTISPVTIADQGNYYLRISNACGMSIFVTSLAIDNISPQISCPGDIEQPADPGLCSAVVNYQAPAGTDNCPGATTLQIGGLPSGSAFPVGTTVNAFRVTDVAGRSAECSFSVTIVDKEPPVIAVPNSGSQIQCYYDIVHEPVSVIPTATDNCGGIISGKLASVIDDPVVEPYGFTCEGKRTYTYSFSDNANPPNVSYWTYVYTVVVEDFTIPETLDHSTVECASAALSSNVTVPVAKSSDCELAPAIVPTGPVKNKFNTDTYDGCEGTISYTWTYTDCSGRYSHDWTYTYTVDRTIAPTQVGGPVATSSTVKCRTDAVEPTLPIVEDVCGTTLTPTGPGISGTYSGCEGTVIYTYKYTDCAGLPLLWSYTYTIDRTTAPSEVGGPVATSSPVECVGDATAPALPVVKDYCGATLPAPTPVITDEITGCEGTIKYTYTYTDCAGLDFVWTYTYTVDRTIAPTQVGNPVATSSKVECIANAVEPTLPIVEDVCGTTLIPTGPGISSTYSGCEGTVIYTYKYTDCAGLPLLWSYTYTIDMTTPPAISNVPLTVYVNTGPGNTLCSQTATWSAPTAVDACGNSLTGVASHAPGSTFAVGTTTVTYTFTDCTGATSKASFDVVVTDNTAPVVKTQNLTVYLNSTGKASITPAQVNNGSTDNCTPVADLGLNLDITAFTCDDVASPPVPPTAWINEFHYDNTGTDAGEFVEIAATAGLDLTNWKIYLYNGADGKSYTPTTTLSGIITDQTNGFGFVSKLISGIQNGAPDGIALVNASSTVIQFLSYEGSFVATDGPASGMTSVNIGVSENGTGAVGNSLQLKGSGNTYGSFTWDAEKANTAGAVNTDQTFVAITPSAGVTVTLSVSDANGNTGTGKAIVTVLDNLPPIVSAPNTVDLECSTALPPAATTMTEFLALAGAAASDNCTPPASLLLSSSTGNLQGTSCNGTITRVYTLKDASGNSTSVDHVFTVTDNTPPTAVAKNITIQLNASGTVSITPSDVNNGSNDNCSNVTLVSVVPSAFTCANVGAVNTVTLTVKDACGNTGTASTTVTVQDVTPPTVLTQNITVDLDVNGEVAITAGQIDNGSSDACGILSRSVSPDEFLCDDVTKYTSELFMSEYIEGANNLKAIEVFNGTGSTVTLTGNYSLQMFFNGAVTPGTTINLTGSIAPNGVFIFADAAAGPAVTSIANQVSSAGLFNGDDVVALYKGSTLIDVIGQIGFDPGSEWGTGLTSTADNTLRRKSTILVGDNNGSDAFNPAIEWDGYANNTIDGLGSHSVIGGAKTVTLTVTDVNGNSASKTASVTVRDITPPLAKAQNVTVQLDASGNGSTTAVLVNNGSTDACGIKSLALSKTAFTCADIATNPNMVTLTVTDNNGNVQTCQAEVTVQDLVKPVASCKPATVSLDKFGKGSIAVADIDNGSSDACGITSLVLSKTAFTCADIANNPNIVTLTVTDNNGNTQTCQAEVTVQDLVKPTASCKAATVSLDATGNGSIAVADIDNGSSDACGITSLVLSKTAFTCADIANNPNIVTLTVTDNNGNTQTCQAEVTVQDLVKPTASCKPATVSLDEFGKGSIAVADIDGGSTDACGIASLTASKTIFGCADLGLNTVTLTVTDNNGNSSTCQATVTVMAEACGTYTGTVYANTSGPSVMTTLVDLAVAVSSPSGCKIDPSKTNFSFTINADNYGSVSLKGLPVFDASTSTFKQQAEVTIKTLPATIIDVKWVIGGYYTNAADCDPNSIITVAVPGSDFSAGGGYIYPANPKGTKPAVSTKKNNFGYNIKWAKNYSKLTGNFNTIWRADGITYQAKSNSASALIITKVTSGTCTGYKAQITYSNVNMKQLDCLVNCWADGNGKVILTVYDWGEPGSNGTQTCKDQIGFAVKDKNGVLIYSTNTYNATQADPTLVQVLDGGNIQVLPSSVTRAEDVIAVQPPQVPENLKLEVYPNPTAGPVNFRFSIPENAKVTLEVYTVTGRLVDRIFQGDIEAGVEKTAILSKPLPEGVYSYRLIYGTKVKTGKIIKTVTDR